MASLSCLLSLRMRRTCMAILASILLVLGLLSTSEAVQANSTPLVTLPNSVASLAGATLLGAHSSTAQMTVELVLQPNNAAQLNSLMAALYNPQSSQYHQWLPTGTFNARFAPTSAQIAQVTTFLVQAGLTVVPASTPFLLRASGTTAQVEAALHTQISNYRTSNGQTFFQNATSVQVPASLSGLILGVVGLSNTARLHTHYITARQAAQHSGQSVPKYGAGPGGSGLTPNQTTSLYDAQGVYQQGEQGKGKGATLAVFELSGYTPSDITTYEQQFFGSQEQVPLSDINVDGGPITPQCPKGDQCGSVVPLALVNARRAVILLTTQAISRSKPTSKCKLPSLPRLIAFWSTMHPTICKVLRYLTSISRLPMTIKRIRSVPVGGCVSRTRAFQPPGLNR